MLLPFSHEVVELLPYGSRRMLMTSSGALVTKLVPSCTGPKSIPFSGLSSVVPQFHLITSSPICTAMSMSRV